MTEEFDFEPNPVVSTPTKQKRNPLDAVLMIAAVVALAGIAFATGRLTAPASATTAAANGAANGAAGASGAQGGPGGRTRGSFDPNASFAPGQGGFGGQAGGQPGGGALGGGALGGGGASITGSVVSVSATEITVQLANGTTINIPIDSSTAYHAQTSAKGSDVKAGAKVEIQVTAGVRAPNASGAPAPNASGAPRAANLGTASSITILP